MPADLTAILINFNGKIVKHKTFSKYIKVCLIILLIINTTSIASSIQL